MMRYCFFLFLTFPLTGCYNIERNCVDYKTGEFYSESSINGETVRFEFIRTKNLQIESYLGKTDSIEVRWINDCEMVFKTINPQNRIEKKDVHLKILTTTDSSYTYEYSYVGENLKQKGVAYLKKT